MVEVFKTNVRDRNQADMLIDQIHRNCVDYKANFDLEDCDNILRVKSATGLIESSYLIDLLKNFGCDAEVLADD